MFLDCWWWVCCLCEDVLLTMAVGNVAYLPPMTALPIVFVSQVLCYCMLQHTTWCIYMCVCVCGNVRFGDIVRSLSLGVRETY